MCETMQFPDSWQDFLHQYEFRDDVEEYTNGSMLIPSFRVEQMMEHYSQYAVPVVRCGECIYFDPEGHDGVSCAETGAMIWPNEDDYCSRGQRREQFAEDGNMDGGGADAP